MKNSQIISSHLVVGVASLMLLLMASPGWTTPVVKWVGNDVDWDVASNWDTNAVPAANDQVLFDTDGVSKTITYANATPLANPLWSVSVRGKNGATATIRQNKDALYAKDEYLGSAWIWPSPAANLPPTHPVGRHEQDGGSNTLVNSLHLGYRENSRGEYALTGGELSASIEYIGQKGAGDFKQTAGSNKTGSLILGEIFSSYGRAEGRYELGGTGVLSATQMDVGFAGDGTMIQTGGTNSVVLNLRIGYDVSSQGSYDLSGGQLTTTGTIVGQRGTGDFKQSAGSTHTVKNSLSVGQAGQGSYTLNGGTLTAQKEYLGGQSPNSQGTFTQNGGTNTVKYDLSLGYNATSKGIYNMNGGTLAANYLILGNSQGTGEVLQTGGDVKVTGVNLANSSLYTMQGGALEAQRNIVVGKESAFHYQGGSARANGKILNYGRIDGTGTFTTPEFYNVGMLAPGASPGQIDISGNFTQYAAATLAIEIAGALQGSEYDFLNITGTASLGGFLDVDLLGFNPVSGSEFNILHAADGIVTGTVFNDVILPSLVSGLYWDLVYESNDVILKVLGQADGTVPAPTPLLLMLPGLLFTLSRRWAGQNIMSKVECKIF